LILSDSSPTSLARPFISQISERQKLPLLPLKFGGKENITSLVSIFENP